VDSGDLTVWQTHFGWQIDATNSADFDQDGDVDGRDFLIWQRNVGRTESIIEMAFSQDNGVTFTAFEDFSPEKQLTLTGNDGTKEIIVRFRDEVGNAMDIQDTIILDTHAPVPFDAVLLGSFLNPTPAQGDRFGQVMATVGNNTVVGVRLDDAVGQDSGAIYIFDTDSESPTFGNLLKTITNPKNANYEYFGSSVTTLGNNIVVGATFAHASPGESTGGAVYIFDGDSTSPVFGSLLKTILNPTPSGYDEFGKVITTIGSNIVVAAPYDYNGGADQSGAIYVFDGNPASPTFGNRLKTILNPTPGIDDNFGENITTLGNNIVVMVPNDDAERTDSGVVHIFDGDRSSPTFGNLLKTITNPTPNYFELFGTNVFTVEDLIVVTMPNEDAGGTDVGVVYVFDGDRSSPTFGNLLKTIANPTPNYFDRFGTSVTALGNDIVIAAPYDNAFASESGVIYVFDGDRSSPTFGNLLKTIANPTPGYYDHFGSTITSVGNYIVVTASEDDTGGIGVGAVYVFDSDRSSPIFGDPLKTIISPTPLSGEDFGSNFITTANDLIIADPSNKAGTIYSSGAVYYYKFKVLSILINNDQATTNSPDVMLTLAANDNLTSQSNLQMAFSQDGINFTSYEPFMATKQITLEGPDGEKTVYVRFRDEAGNVSEFSDTIILQQGGAGSLSSASIEPLDQTAPSSVNIPERTPLFWQATAVNHFVDQKKTKTDLDLEPKPRKHRRFKRRNGSHSQ
jgi:predicted alpha/beta superfamily hydrolase